MQAQNCEDVSECQTENFYIALRTRGQMCIHVQLQKE